MLPFQATLWSNGNISNISPFDSTESYARSINNAGQIVGSFWNGSAFDAFLYSDGKYIDLGSMGGPSAEAYSINDRGQIVGVAVVQVGPGTYRYKGFLYDRGNMVELNSLISSKLGWDLQWAFDINNKGQIVGYGLLNNEFHAYILTPHKNLK